MVNPSTLFENDGTGKPIYRGMVATGQTGSTSSKIWQIAKYTYDGNGGITSIKYARGGQFACAWDDRASETYA